MAQKSFVWNWLPYYVKCSLKVVHSNMLIAQCTSEVEHTTTCLLAYFMRFENDCGFELGSNVNIVSKAGHTALIHAVQFCIAREKAKLKGNAHQIPWLREAASYAHDNKTSFYMVLYLDWLGLTKILFLLKESGSWRPLYLLVRIKYSNALKFVDHKLLKMCSTTVCSCIL